MLLLVSSAPSTIEALSPIIYSKVGPTGKLLRMYFAFWLGSAPFFQQYQGLNLTVKSTNEQTYLCPSKSKDLAIYIS